MTSRIWRPPGRAWLRVLSACIDRQFVEYHDGVIDHLDKTATKLVDSDTMLVYRITRP